jgi:hypothetical protein
MTFPPKPGRFRSRHLTPLLTLLLPALLLSACGTADVLTPERGRSVELLKMDASPKPSTVDAGGARWVLFKLDFGRGARRVVRTAVDGAATVGQSVADLSPEESIMQFIDAARETARVDQARAALSGAAPSLPRSAIP